MMRGAYPLTSMTDNIRPPNSICATHAGSRRRDAYQRQNTLNPQMRMVAHRFSNSSGRVVEVMRTAYCMQRGKACRTHELTIAHAIRITPFRPPPLGNADTKQKSHVACKHRWVDRLIIPKRVILRTNHRSNFGTGCSIIVNTGGMRLPARVYFCISVPLWRLNQ